MRLSILAASIWMVAAPASAERITLDYEGVAFGLASLGSATLDADISGDQYRVSSTLRSGGLLALFERTRLSALAEGSVDAGVVQAGRYDLDHFYARKHRVTTVEWGAQGVESEIAPTYRLWGDPPATEAQRRESRDPLSSLLAMAVDAAHTRRCEGDYPTFDGRFHYRMRLDGGQMVQFHDGGFNGWALRCTLRYEPIAGFEASDGGRRMRTRSGQIWFGLIDAAFAPPVRIVVPLPVGAAAIKLVSWRRVSVQVAEN